MAEERLRVLFLCTGNSARSQIAESILRYLSSGAIDVVSAGTDPQLEIQPLARKAVQALIGVDMAGQFPKSLDAFRHQHFDYVITVCDNAAEHCPVFSGVGERIHWSLADPAAVTDTDESRQKAFDNTAHELLSRLRRWLVLPAVQSRVKPHETSSGRR